MKTFEQKLILGIFLMLFYSNTFFAQRALEPATLLSIAKRSTDLPLKEHLLDNKYKNDLYLTIRFSNVPNKNVLNKLNITLLEYIGYNIYLSKIPVKNYSTEHLKNAGITHIFQNVNELKVAASLITEKSVNERVTIAIQFHENITEEDIKNILQKSDFQILNTLRKNVLIGTLQQKNIKKLSAHPLISFIDAWQGEDTMLNNEVSKVLKTNVLSANFTGGRKLKGKGVVVGVGDGGTLGSHLDFGKRVIDFANGTYSSFGTHGDHVSGTIGANGSINPRHKGMASECTIITQKTSNIISLANNYRQQYGMTLTNNSYGATSTCSSYGEYNYTSQNIDWQMREYPDLLHIFAAGNDGGANCSVYPNGYGNVLRAYAVAKNSLTVGSVNDLGVISGFSGRGPVKDGRIKPEVCGVGELVVSTNRSFSYVSMSGTSMAAPSVTGTLALLIERFKQLNNNQNPTNDLLKAIVCNTAEDKGNLGPDYMYGFGVVNSLRAVETIEKKSYFLDTISINKVNTHSITIPQGLSQLKVMLYWADKEATAYPTKALVNNLDLSVKTPANEQILPWVLDTTKINVSKPATRGIDFLNNIEQVTIDNPTPGQFSIQVKGTDFPLPDVSSQNYVIVYEFITPNVRLTFPNGDETLEPNTNYLIQWEATDNNSTPFKLEFSNNNGTSWETINGNIDSNTRSYTWKTPSYTIENLKVRVSRTNTAYSSVNYLPARVLASPIISLTNVCNNNVKIEWNSIENATKYEVYIYDIVKGEWKILGETQKTDFTVQNNQLLPDSTFWFTTKAFTNNNKTSEMAIAKSIKTTINAPSCPTTNNVSLLSIILPDDGREYTSIALTETEEISVLIGNEGTSEVSNFPITLSINNEKITETCTAKLAANTEYLFTFNKKFDLSVPKTYTVDAWISLEGDNNTSNDSLINKVKCTQLANKDAVFPNFLSLNQLVPAEYEIKKIGLLGAENIDFEGIGNSTLVTKNINQQAEISLSTNTNGSLAEASGKIIINVNLQNYKENKIVFSVEYKTIIDGIYEIWVRGSDTNNWIKIGNISHSPNLSTTELFDLQSILKSNGQEFSTSTQISITQSGNAEIIIQKLLVENAGDLPVELAFFKAKKIQNNEHVHLQWRTLSEINNDRFEVEVATTEYDFMQNHFRKLTTIKGKGTTSEINDYQYFDVSSNKYGTYYYRLKQIDTDGTFEYSKVIAVKFDIKNELNVYPSIVQDGKIYVETPKMKNDAILDVVLYDLSGKVMFTKEFQSYKTGEKHTLQFNNDLESGYYILNVKENKKQSQNFKVFIIKE